MDKNTGFPGACVPSPVDTKGFAISSKYMLPSRVSSFGFGYRNQTEKEKPEDAIGDHILSPPDDPGAATPADKNPPGRSAAESMQSTSKKFSLPSSAAL